MEVLKSARQRTERQFDRNITLSLYIPLIILSAIIILLSLLFTIGQIHSKTQDNIHNQLQSFSKESDLKYSRAKYAAYQLSFNSLIDDWLRSDSPVADQYQLWKIQNSLYALTTSDSDIFSIDIYDNQHDSYLSTYDGYWENSNVLLFVNSNEPALQYKNTTSQVATIYQMNAQHTMLSLVYTLPSNSLFGTVSINMPIDDFLQGNINPKDRLFITNRSYSRVYSAAFGTAADTSLFRAALAFLSRSGDRGSNFNVLNYSGQKYYVTAHPVFDDQFNLVYLTPALPAVVYLRGYSHYAAVILLLIGVLGHIYSRFLCRLSKEPLSDIATRIRSLLTAGPAESAGNDIEYIQNSVAHLIDRNHENEKAIENYRMVLLRESLKNLLLGRYFEESAEYLKSTDMCGPERQLAVIAFFSRMEDTAVSDRPGSDSLEAYHTFWIRMGKGYDTCVLRLNPGQDAAGLEERLGMAADAGRFIAGISRPIAEIDTLHTAYLEAADALKAADDDTPVVRYLPERFRKRPDNRTFSLEDGEMLIGKLRNAPAEEIRETISSDIDKKYRLYSPELFDAYVLYLISCLSKVAMEFQLNPREILTADSLGLFSGYDTVENKKHFLISQVEKVVTARGNRQRRFKKLFMDSVENYIQSRFDRPISLTNIAADLHISPSYLSSTIKEELGVNFLTYVNSLRMHRATELLGNSRLSIKEIGPMTGYDSEHSFIRNFKKVFHMTPSEYRNRLRQPEPCLSAETFPPAGVRGVCPVQVPASLADSSARSAK